MIGHEGTVKGGSRDGDVHCSDGIGYGLTTVPYSSMPDAIWMMSGYSYYWCLLIIARSASYVRTALQNLSSVRACVRKIIDFCEEYMNPRHMLLSTETLKTRF